jgi:hypothetical protein
MRSAALLVLASFMGAVPEQLMGLFLPRDSRFGCLEAEAEAQIHDSFWP